MENFNYQASARNRGVKDLGVGSGLALVCGGLAWFFLASAGFHWHRVCVGNRVSDLLLGWNHLFGGWSCATVDGWAMAHIGNGPGSKLAGHQW